MTIIGEARKKPGTTLQARDDNVGWSAKKGGPWREDNGLPLFEVWIATQRGSWGLPALIQAVSQ